MTEDRYLDSSRVIRELDDACRPGGNLDEQGVLDELAKAAKHCDVESRKHQEAADAYILARAYYFLEIHRRVVTGTGKHGERGGAGRGFLGWCRQAGVTRQSVAPYLKIAKANDPLATLREMRARREAWARQRRRDAADALDAMGTPRKTGVRRDPLRSFKIACHRLSPIQRREAMRWLIALDPSTCLELASAILEGRGENPYAEAAE